LFIHQQTPEGIQGATPPEGSGVAPFTPMTVEVMKMVWALEITRLLQGLTSYPFKSQVISRVTGQSSKASQTILGFH